MPSFWFGLLLVEVFSLHLGLLPVSGYGTGFFGHLESLTLPAITVGIYLAPLIIRTLRVEPDRDARRPTSSPRRARAASARRASIGKHALRNALIATITILAINIGYLISGSVVIENVFAHPGPRLAARLVDPDARLPDDLGADAALRRARDRSSTCSPTSRTRSSTRGSGSDAVAAVDHARPRCESEKVRLLRALERGRGRSAAGARSASGSASAIVGLIAPRGAARAADLARRARTSRTCSTRCSRRAGSHPFGTDNLGPRHLHADDLRGPDRPRSSA